MKTVSVEITGEVLGPDCARGMQRSLQGVGSSHLHLFSPGLHSRIIPDPTKGNRLF